MKRHLVIFARAPQFGRVKRRLAATIGPVAAMRFYRADPGAPDPAPVARSPLDGLAVRHARPSLAHPAWRGAVPRTRAPPGQGDLGPTHEAAVSAAAARARRAGRQRYSGDAAAPHRARLPPAGTTRSRVRSGERRRLLAGRCTPRPAAAALAVRRVRWSTAHALADTLAGSRLGYTTGIADTLDDVDDAQDLQRCRSTGRALCLSRSSSRPDARRTPCPSRPAAGWRNRRAEGYQGARVPPSCQRQSTVDGSSTQVLQPHRRRRDGRSARRSRSADRAATARSPPRRNRRCRGRHRAPGRRRRTAGCRCWCTPPCRLNTSSSGSPASARNSRERRRALAILRLAGHGRPVDADAQLGLLDAAELDAAVGRRLQVGRLHGQRVEVGAAEMRQRHHRGMQVERPAASRPRPRRRR